MREFGNNEKPTNIFYDEVEMLSRLQAMLGEELSVGKSLYCIPKFKHTRQEIHDSLYKAFWKFVNEFKEETVKLV